VDLLAPGKHVLGTPRTAGPRCGRARASPAPSPPASPRSSSRGRDRPRPPTSSARS
jgi:hypothetical protein